MEMAVKNRGYNKPNTGRVIPTSRFQKIITRPDPHSFTAHHTGLAPHRFRYRPGERAFYRAPGNEPSLITRQYALESPRDWLRPELMDAGNKAVDRKSTRL